MSCLQVNSCLLGCRTRQRLIGLSDARGPRLPSKRSTSLSDRRGRGLSASDHLRIALQAALKRDLSCGLSRPFKAPGSPESSHDQLQLFARVDHRRIARSDPSPLAQRAQRGRAITRASTCRPSRRECLHRHATPSRLLRRAGPRRSPRRCRRRPEEVVGAAATARPPSRGRPHAWESSPTTET